MWGRCKGETGEMPSSSEAAALVCAGEGEGQGPMWGRYGARDGVQIGSLAPKADIVQLQEVVSE